MYFACNLSNLLTYLCERGPCVSPCLSASAPSWRRRRIAAAEAMQAVLAALSLSLAPGVRVAAPLGGRLRPVSMTASLEAPTTAPKSFDELDAQAADRMPQRTRTLDE